MDERYMTIERGWGQMGQKSHGDQTGEGTRTAYGRERVMVGRSGSAIRVEATNGNQLGERNMIVIREGGGTYGEPYE